MPSGNLQIFNATLKDEGSYKCAAYNPITKEVKTSTSTDRLRIRRESPPPAQNLLCLHYFHKNMYENVENSSIQFKDGL